MLRPNGQEQVQDEELMIRDKPDYDGAEPSGNSIAAMNLLRLYAFTSDPRYLKLVNISPDEVEAGNIRKSVGCPNCGGTGYRGRKAIFELMRMNAEAGEP